MTRTRVVVAAAVASTAAAALMLTACSGGGGGTATFSPNITTEAPAATSDVDSITWNLPAGELTSLDPAQSALESNSTIVGNLCESLQTVSATGEVSPALATSIDATSDTTYVISLRDDVTFWDGQPMTAADVVYSINRVLDPTTASPWAIWALGGATVEQTGENEVTVTTATPVALTDEYFHLPPFAVVEQAFSESAGADFGTAAGGVMCTGPYKLDTWNPGQDLTIVKNDSWWNTDATARLGEVTFTFTADPSAQVAGLRSGSIDGQFQVPVSGFSSLSASGNLLFNNSLQTNFLANINLDGGLADVKARQALQEVVDYTGIVQSIYLGTAEPLRAIVPPGAWGYSTDVYQAGWDALPAAEQDLDGAKAALAESTYNGEEIVLAYPSSVDEAAKISTAIADAANSIGLKVTLKPLQLADYLAIFSSPDARAGIDTFFAIGYLDFPEPAAYYQFFTTSSFYNFAGYSNPDYDTAIASALSEFDDNARAQDVVDAQAIIADDYANIPLDSDYTNVYYSNELAGLVPDTAFIKYSPWLVALGGK